MGFWSKFEVVAKTIAPVVLAVVPGIPPVLISDIVSAIITTEETAKLGADKKTGVLLIATNALEALNATKGRTVIDPAVVIPAVSRGIDAVVTTVNAIQAAHQRP